MKRNVFVSLLMLALLAVVGIGCGENSTTGPSNLVIDSTNFLVVDDVIGDDYFSSAFQSMDLSFALLDSIPFPAAPEKSAYSDFATGAEDIIISSISQYTFSNGWHIFDFEGTAYDPISQITSAVTGTDSIQVIEDGIAVQFPQGDDFIDALKLRAHVLWQTDPTSSTGSFHHALDVEILRTEVDTILVISGSASDSVYAVFGEGSTVCVLDVSMNQTITALSMNSNGDECPTSGTINMSASIDLACTDTSSVGTSLDSLSISSQWLVTATVNNDGSVTVHYSDNTTQWTVTQPCEYTPATAPRWWTRD